MTSPLRRYFERHPEETHARLAERCRIPLDSIRAYVHGRRKPGRVAAVTIDRATGGEVTPACWDRDVETQPAVEAVAPPAEAEQ